MKKITNRCFKSKLAAIFVMAAFLLPARLQAQCTTASYGQYPATPFTVSACNGIVQTIATNCWGSEYSVVNVVSGETYTFSSSVVTDFITVANNTGTITAYTSGTGPLVWVASITGEVRFYTHADAACGASTTNRARRVACGIQAANDAEVANIYTLGKIPLNYGNNHVVQARIVNSGTGALSNVNVTLNITGANSFTDVQTIVSLAPGAAQTVSFAPFSPATAGSNTLTVSVPADGYTANDSRTWTQVVTTNLASYKDGAAANTGGIGFTGATGDFVARFNAAISGTLNEIKVDFSAGGQPYKVGIWDATGAGGTPGAMVWESPSYTSATGTAFIPVPSISVNGPFFVGVRQTGTANVRFAYQADVPVRANTFYRRSPSTSTTWIDFTVTPNNFRLSIEPQFFLPQPPNCAATFSPVDNAATVNPVTTTNLSWASGGGGATNYDVYFGTTYPPPFVVNTTGTTHPVTLAGNTTYYWSIIAKNTYGEATGCDTIQFTTIAPPVNDNAPGAIELLVDAPCVDTPYTNLYATQSASEAYPNCKGTTGYRTVWFKFTAPASGAVKISNDGEGALGDSRMALFEVGNVNDYGTFNIVACDDDNGVTTSARSLFYATGLAPSNTYYIVVDGYSATTVQGAFCLTVEELTSGMLASSAGTCEAGQGISGLNTAYNGWVSLVDEDGNLNVNVRKTAGTGTAFSASRTITTGASRSDAAGTAYLNRNFLVTGANTTGADLQLFFLDDEVSQLGSPLSGLNMSRVGGTDCAENATGTFTALSQVTSTSANGVSWLQVSTPGFSNFFVMNGNDPLPVELKAISARNAGSRNRVDWSTAQEDKGEYFELERSADGKKFSFLSRITAKGIASDYTYWDNALVAGVNYYRLKITSNEGKKVYSSIVNATVGNKTGFTISATPNPVRNTLKIAISGNTEQSVITLTDITGRTISTVPAVASEVQIDMSGLARGMYLIRYSDDARSETIKVNKQ